MRKSKRNLHRIVPLFLAFLFIVVEGEAQARDLNGQLKLGVNFHHNPSVQNVLITLFEATESTPVRLATTKTGKNGQFTLKTSRTVSDSIFFLSAIVGNHLEFITILGDTLPDSATVSEFTSIAGSFSMAQFYRQGYIAGTSKQLRLAAIMSRNIANPLTGEISEVLLSSPNADQTTTLRLTRSLANLLNAGVKSRQVTRKLLRLTTDERGKVPANTAIALANLTRNPSTNAEKIFRLVRRKEPFNPHLHRVPDQWSIAIKVNDTGSPDVLFGGPGNLDFDSRGYAWVTNNVTQGTPNSTQFNIVLRPDGKPVSPFNTGGLLGVGWGVKADQYDQIWYGNFGWVGLESSPDDYYPSQYPDSESGTGPGSLSVFDAQDGSAISPDMGYFGPYRVQAIDSDDAGNVWMASYGIPMWQVVAVFGFIKMVISTVRFQFRLRRNINLLVWQ